LTDCPTDVLERQRETWRRKPVLRAVYDDFYDRIASWIVPGPTLEIGGGIGNLKQRLQAAAPGASVISSDIQFGAWLDCIADAQALPFRGDSVANIVMVDVCHHLQFPIKFFRDAERVLSPGGRIVMVEPAITWGSTLFYRLLHHEPVCRSADPLADGARDPVRDPYAANQAIPTLIATREAARFHAALPDLRIKRVDWFSLAVYPLSGGFKQWSLIPAAIVERALRLERSLETVLGPALGFRMMAVIEKTIRSGT